MFFSRYDAEEQLQTRMAKGDFPVEVSQEVYEQLGKEMNRKLMYNMHEQRAQMQQESVELEIPPEVAFGEY